MDLYSILIHMIRPDRHQSNIKHLIVRAESQVFFYCKLLHQKSCFQGKQFILAFKGNNLQLKKDVSVGNNLQLICNLEPNN